MVCCRTDHPLAKLDAVTADDLRDEPFVAMRSGYLMHRYAHRLFGGKLPATSFSTDGAEMGKLMVADGLGVTVLPDYSIDGDPMVRGRAAHPPADRRRHDHGHAADAAPPGRPAAAARCAASTQALLERARAHTQSA